MEFSKSLQIFSSLTTAVALALMAGFYYLAGFPCNGSAVVAFIVMLLMFMVLHPSRPTADAILCSVISSGFGLFVGMCMFFILRTLPDLPPLSVSLFYDVAIELSIAMLLVIVMACMIMVSSRRHGVSQAKITLCMFLACVVVAVGAYFLITSWAVSLGIAVLAFLIAYLRFTTWMPQLIYNRVVSVLSRKLASKA